jgi:hypothetical protein
MGGGIMAMRECSTGGWELISRNIGRFATIRSDLKAGRHTVTCELLEETKDPGGGHEFRLISMMR